jgi:hypothetical protein
LPPNSLEPPFQQRFGGFRISLPLDEEVQNPAFIVHGAPMSIAFPADQVGRCVALSVSVMRR